MKALIFYKFQGNIEGDTAICNVSECTQFSTKPNQMFIPAEHCRELPSDLIEVEKRLFNKLEKQGEITYKFN